MHETITSYFTALFRAEGSLQLWIALQIPPDIPAPINNVSMRAARAKGYLVAKTSLTVQDTCRVTKIRIPTARIISDCGMLVPFPSCFDL